MLAYMAGIPHRIGYDLPDVRSFLTDPIPYRAGHTVLQDMRLVERWTGPVKNDDISYRFPITDTDREHISLVLAEAEIPATRPIVVIHAGAGTTLKRWMPENWAIVADRLVDAMGATIVFTGSDQEHPQIMAVIGEDAPPNGTIAGGRNEYRAACGAVSNGQRSSSARTAARCISPSPAVRRRFTCTAPLIRRSSAPGEIRAARSSSRRILAAVRAASSTGPVITPPTIRASATSSPRRSTTRRCRHRGRNVDRRLLPPHKFLRVTQTILPSSSSKPPTPCRSAENRHWQFSLRHCLANLFARVHVNGDRLALDDCRIAELS